MPLFPLKKRSHFNKKVHIRAGNASEIPGGPFSIHSACGMPLDHGLGDINISIRFNLTFNSLFYLTLTLLTFKNSLFRIIGNLVPNIAKTLAFRGR